MSATSLAPIATAFALLAISLPASAATVTRSFMYGADTTGPIAHHELAFTFSYDDVTLDATLLAIDYGVGLTVFSPANAAVFSQAPQGAPGFYSLFGSIAGTGFQFVNGVGNDDFLLSFELADLGNTQFSYSIATTTPNFGTALDDIPLIEIRNPVPVPEPEAWAMMILGFGITAGALRRRKRTARSSQALPLPYFTR